ncbi:MAG: SCO family protein [Leptospiraceae bacterium]|nr:SCO family protein [Leptospiraceae bacterium]
MGKQFLFNLFLFILLISYCKEVNSSGNDDFQQAIHDFKSKGLDKVESPGKGLPFLATEHFDLPWNSEDKDIIKIPNYNFKNQNNNFVTHKKMNDKISIACFFYTQCGGYCPLIMKHMKKIRDAFPDDKNIYLVSYSVTPDYDTPKVLTRYSNTTGFGKFNWDLVTGDKKEIYKLARETFNADTNTLTPRTSNDFIHSEHIYIIDSKRKLRGIYDGNVNGDIERVIKDVKILKQSENIDY